MYEYNIGIHVHEKNNSTVLFRDIINYSIIKNSYHDGTSASLILLM